MDRLTHPSPNWFSLRSRVLIAALVLDAVCGEPPAPLHPVVWMGRLLAWLETRAPRGELASLAYGSAVALGLPLVFGGLAYLVERWGPWPVQALVLKPAFAGRALLDAGCQVEAALATDDLAGARTHLRSLVSRSVDNLDGARVASAAIESLAENFVDSWVAPLMAYAAFGLPAAYVYRAANTADAMWGYHSPRYEHLGKPAARLDDLLNLVPARVGALFLLLAADRRRDALVTWRRDAAHCGSPNAGQTMAVAAGALGVRLEKLGHYELNAGAPAPAAHSIAAARRLVHAAMVLAAGATLVAHMWRKTASSTHRWSRG